ncbi:hypothetical protein K469DRAFT_718342 [Zopfia rhizophila CBS 207.26]|uniref:Uncharacterized protein n=1 Tax=Zopfia rhizophila CBS 207.26 TaxID=1314779 RepID=A0A6A6DKY6_9PEZI|nr:hypothetical protein K469DRAFT_718342 [Zopfia rhizophila CBS 207.26]
MEFSTNVGSGFSCYGRETCCYFPDDMWECAGEKWYCGYLHRPSVSVDDKPITASWNLKTWIHGYGREVNPSSYGVENVGNPCEARVSTWVRTCRGR